MLVPFLQCKIVDDDGKIVPAGKPGELCFKGPNVMKGYYKKPEATKHCVRDGWFHTGDIGYVNENGYYFIVDRIKELIKVKGFQVAPAELEAMLLEHPKIADCAVTAKPDHESGEVPKAFVVLKPSFKASPTMRKDIEKFISDRVAKYKRIKDLAFVPSVPKSASGKILRRLLRAEEKRLFKIANQAKL